MGDCLLGKSRSHSGQIMMLDLLFMDSYIYLVECYCQYSIAKVVVCHMKKGVTMRIGTPARMVDQERT